jgi:hypothetical protein
MLWSSYLTLTKDRSKSVTNHNNQLLVVALKFPYYAKGAIDINIAGVVISTLLMEYERLCTVTSHQGSIYTFNTSHFLPCSRQESYLKGMI